jgi:hypothetical protein
MGQDTILQAWDIDEIRCQRERTRSQTDDDGSEGHEPWTNDEGPCEIEVRHEDVDAQDILMIEEGADDDD